MNEYPVINMVDNLLALAIARTASDIHFEPTNDYLAVRLRIDGVLYDLEPINQTIMQQLLTRIKVLAHINIAEKRIPQDGKFMLATKNHTIDLRVSTFPCLYGEKIVVRILDRIDYTRCLDTLGFDNAMIVAIREIIAKSNGFFLVAGPTGSGKTTTLYAALRELNTREKNIITLEDPIEYCIPGITQGQIHPDAGFTFEKGMRALLRQDPDIVMIGEIRDRQTAGIAIEAALTGHLVFSTVHTGDAPSVIMRLMDMGIEPFLMNAAITGVLSQRLVRKLCSNCKIKREPTQDEKTTLNKYNVDFEYTYSSSGCVECAHLGYKGRTGIFELLKMTNPLRALIVQHPSFEAIQQQALADGMQSLVSNGLQKVQAGLISLKELMRVI